MCARITIEDFKQLELRVGTVLSVRKAAGAHKSAYQLTINFGALGQRRSSARITDHYKPDDLVGRQVVAVVNLPPKRVGSFVSEVLVLGGYEGDGTVRLLKPETTVTDGARLL